MIWIKLARATPRGGSQVCGQARLKRRGCAREARSPPPFSTTALALTFSRGMQWGRGSQPATTVFRVRREIVPSKGVAAATVLEIVPYLRTLRCSRSSRASSSSVSMISS